jgi:hypothetical protein
MIGKLTPVFVELSLKKNKHGQYSMRCEPSNSREDEKGMEHMHGAGILDSGASINVTVHDLEISTQH